MFWCVVSTALLYFWWSPSCGSLQYLSLECGIRPGFIFLLYTSYRILTESPSFCEKSRGPTPLPFLLSMSLLKETEIIHRSSLSCYRVWVRWAGRLALALLQELAYRKAIKVRNGCRLVRQRGADTASIRQASSASPHGSVRLAVVCDWDDTLPTPAFTLPEKIDK